MGYFWQKKIALLQLTEGPPVLGEIHARDQAPLESSQSAGSSRGRIQVKVGNRELWGADFRWIDEFRVVRWDYPPDAVVLERREWGNFYGTLVELRSASGTIARGADEVWSALGPLQVRKSREHREIRRIETKEIGAVNLALETLRLEARRLEMRPVAPAEAETRRAAIRQAATLREQEFAALTQRLDALRERFVAETLVIEAADGTRREIPAGQVVRAVRPNAMGLTATLGLYLGRLTEFVTDEPRESNTEGGIFPAIFGTVLMVFLMSIAVVPLGVLAALYLREYARQGLMVRIVRIAVNNLAGVPSIVFGVFGLGFFVYLVGGTLDRLFFAAALPSPTFGTGGILWASLTLALLTVPVVIVATEEGLAAVPRVVREGSLALGATKFETTWRVVIPAAAPGILTGLILAMARAAGEVAPLMIVGMVKLAPSLPVDGQFPYVHLERKFMHLGFHIYDVGFQSPNVDATKPLVFATALLLIAVVTTMNLVAIAMRNRLRRAYASSAV
jgi:phosphate transport system permease protein